MAKALVLWELNFDAMPKEPAEQGAIFGKLAEMTKKALDSGKVKDWGIFPGGAAGYSIIDEAATDTLTRAFMFNPYVKFIQVSQVLGMAEVTKVMQSLPK